MKRLFLLLLLFLRPVHAQSIFNAVLSASDTGACTMVGACLQVAVAPTMGGVTFTITTNASSNTIQFEASGDFQKSWVSINATPSNSTTAVTSTTGTGTWQANVAGYTNVRLRMSTLVSGTTSVSINQSIASARSGGGGGSGTGITYVTSNPSSPYIAGTTYYNSTSNQFLCATTTTVLISCTGPTSGVDPVGLMGLYLIPATDSACAITDSSGNNNNATGCTGTSPTIVSGSGGLLFAADGSVQLPAALNPALTVISVQSMQPSSQANPYVSPVIGNGNGTTSAATGIIFMPINVSTTGPGLGIEALVNYGAGSGQGSGLASLVAGTFSSGVVFGLTGNSTVDVVYQNGVTATELIGPTGASGGQQTTGNYVVGGADAGSGLALTTHIRGTIYALAFYSVQKNAAQMLAINNQLSSIVLQRGIQSGLNTTLAGPFVVCEGDSILSGFGAATPFCELNGAAPPVLIPLPTVFNHAISSTTITELAENATKGQLAEPATGVNVTIPAVVIERGYHDCQGSRTTAQIHQDIATAGKYYRSKGVKVFLTTLNDATSIDTCKNNVNTDWRATAIQQGFADVLMDIGSSPTGADGASASTTLFQDGVHPTQHTHYNIFMPMLQREWDRNLGCQSFSCANIYTTTAAAGVLDTAESETGNTMTFTSTLNPGANTVVSCTGGTITGYNSASYGWYVLTSSASNFTAYNNTTGLAVGSGTHSTCILPSQKDVDRYIILGGSAVGPNFSLETAVGSTSENIYFRNTNSNAWTISAWGAETINGLAQFVLNPQQSICLTSVLVSSSAAGNNWQTCAPQTGTQTVVMTGSAYTNATTTFSSVAGSTGPTLAFPVLASTQYQMSCSLLWSTGTATGGPKFQITGPGSPTAVQISVVQAVTATTDGTAGATAFSSSINASGTTVVTGTNEPAIISMGLVNGTTSGTVTLQAAAQGVGTLTIQPGSYCTVMPVQ